MWDQRQDKKREIVCVKNKINRKKEYVSKGKSFRQNYYKLVFVYLIICEDLPQNKRINLSAGTNMWLLEYLKNMIESVALISSF